jgi:hypothetical protein
LNPHLDPNLGGSGSWPPYQRLIKSQIVILIKDEVHMADFRTLKNVVFWNLTKTRFFVFLGKSRPEIDFFAKIQEILDFWPQKPRFSGQKLSKNYHFSQFFFRKFRQWTTFLWFFL